MTGLYIILFGVLCVGSAGWLVPRGMARARARREQEGRPTERLDALLAAPVYRASLAWVATLGVLAVVFGVIIAVE